MSLYLGVAILLFILLFFTNKEGFYSDTNITSADDDLKTFNKKLDDLKKIVDGFSTSNLSTMDSVASLNKTLETKDSALYSSGVINHVKMIKKELDLYQENVSLLNETILTMPKSVNVYQYTDVDKTNKVAISLIDVIDNLTQQANKISANLNKIPDS
jgi:hypothetical protein